MIPRSEFALRPFSRSPSTDEVTLHAEIEKTDDGFLLTFHFRDPLHRAHAATPTPNPSRKDGLWRTTCFEAFFGVKNSAAYFELNAAPSGDWAWYGFSDYRKGMNSPPLTPESAPRTISRLDDGTLLTVGWLVPTAALAGKEMESLSITAVLEREGDITYWALSHTGSEPDFHRRDSFTIRV